MKIIALPQGQQRFGLLGPAFTIIRKGESQLIADQVFLGERPGGAATLYLSLASRRESSGLRVAFK